MKKPVKWAAGILMTIAVVGYFIHALMQPLEVESVAVQPQTVSQTFKEEGIVTSATVRPVYSLINGNILGLAVKEGQQVKKGDLLAEIESKDLEYQLQQLQAQKKSLLGQEKKNEQDIRQQLGQLKGQLESIQGQEKQAHKDPYAAQIKLQQLVAEDTQRRLDTSKEDYGRIKALYESGAVSKKEVDDALHAVAQLENSLMQQEQTLKLIQEEANPLPGTDQYYSGLKNAIQTQIHVLTGELDQGAKGTAAAKQYYQGLIESMDAQIRHLEYLIAGRKVTSPIQGIVKEVSAKEGGMVSAQSPLLTLTTQDDLEVKVYLLTEDVIYVKEGMKVKLIQKRKNGDYTFGGTVKEIAPAAEEKISALGLTEQKVKVTVTPDDQAPELRSGYALDVQFTVLEESGKLAVPKAALFPFENGDALWVIREGKAVIRQVQKGMETDELAVIQEGLHAGDLVIKNPKLEGLEQGKRVK